MIYEWYLDVFFLSSFLMDLCGLLTAAVCCNQKLNVGKLLLVPAGAVAISILFLILVPGYISYAILVHIVVNPLMVFLTFHPVCLRDFLRLWLTMYLVLAVAGGFQHSIRLQVGKDSAGLTVFWGILAMILFLVWQCRQKILGRICLVELTFYGETISLKAFCDSGNLLRDPVSGAAVSILKKEILPEEWDRKLKDTICRIPFSTLGQGMEEMEIVTLDKMKIFQKGTVKEIDAPRIGLHDGEWMRTPQVQMLLNGSFC